MPRTKSTSFQRERSGSVEPVVMQGEGETYACPVSGCTHTANSIKRMRAHKYQHFYIYTCRYCESSFNSRIGLSRHCTKTHYQQKQLKCIECEKSFRTQDEHEKHLNMEHAQTIACPDCSTQFSTTLEVAHHRIKHHQKEIIANARPLNKSVSSSRADRQPMAHEHHCAWPGCTWTTKIRVHIYNHNRGHVKFFACAYCKFSASHFSYVDKHVAKKHKGSDAMTCEACNITFTTQEEHETHMHQAHGTQFKCPECDDLFETSFAAGKHAYKEHFKDVFRRQTKADDVDVGEDLGPEEPEEPEEPVDPSDTLSLSASEGESGAQSNGDRHDPDETDLESDDIVRPRKRRKRPPEDVPDNSDVAPDTQSRFCPYPACDNTLDGFDALIEHIRLHHFWVCMTDDCGKAFPTNDLRMAHQQQEHVVCMFPGCNASFCSFDRMYAHAAVHLNGPGTANAS